MKITSGTKVPETESGLPRTPSSALRRREIVSASLWLDKLPAKIRATDAVLIVISVFLAQNVRFGGIDSQLAIGGAVIGYTIVSLFLSVLWIASLWITQSTDQKVLGAGSAEYARVIHATLGLFGAVAILSVLVKTPVARGYLAVALPLGLLVLLVSRWLWRKRVESLKANGLIRHRVVVVGGSTIGDILDIIQSGKRSGWEVVGLCRTDGNGSVSGLNLENADIPVATSWRDVRRIVEQWGADTVAVSGADSIGHAGMRELSWDLEGLDVDLLVAPGVVDVAGPRIHMRPVSGLPLLHIDKPRYEGANNFWKALVDRLGALIIVIAISPILVACAFAIKISSAGTIFYSSERIGLNNEAFRMIKFRSMVPGADTMREKIAGLNESGGGVLFKVKNDPRVTSVGAFLRKYSLDELPQLFNVLKGDMSLIGPRPPLRGEVEQYSGPVSRRLLVRPGMTGLWQISGRSDLSWDESVRLDLYYVENWSPIQDILILFKTVRIVINGSGAY